MAFKFQKYTGEAIANLLDKINDGYKAGDGLKLSETNTFSIDESWLRTRMANIYNQISTDTYVSSITIVSSPTAGTETIREKNGQIQLVANVLPSTATNKGVNWASSNASVAEVDGNGLVTAKLASGTQSTTITATATDGKGAVGRYTITVNIAAENEPVTGLATISYDTASIDWNGSTQLSTYVLPTNATNQTINWSSANPTVLSLNKSTGQQVTVTGNNTSEEQVKKVVITASSAENSSYSKTIEITVGKHPITGDIPSILYGTVTFNEGASDANAKKPVQDGVLQNALNSPSTVTVDLKEYGNLGVNTPQFGGLQYSYNLILIPNAPANAYKGRVGYWVDTLNNVDTAFTADASSTIQNAQINGNISVDYNGINYRVYGQYNFRTFTSFIYKVK